MLTIKYQTAFKKDYKKVKKQGYNIKLLQEAIEILASGESLPPKYKNYVLAGEYAGCCECHITPYWFLVYEIKDQELLLYLTRTGTHSDLF